MRKILTLAMLLLGMSIAFTSCEKEPDPIPVAGLTLDAASLTLTEGETARLIATISPSNADNQGVIWSSSNSSVASVSNGTVTAVSAGYATITAKSDDGGKTATCEVTVNPKTISVTGVNLNKTSIELAEGEKTTLLATVLPENATNKNIMWSCSDETIAIVTNGEIMAISPGNAIVNAETEDGGFVAACNVTVKGIKLQNTEISIMEGESTKLSCTCYPSEFELTWSSSDIGIASVDNNGLVIAKKRGRTTISVCSVDGKYSAKCLVVVTDVTDLVDIWCYSFDVSSGSYYNGTFTRGSQISWAVMNNTPYLIDIRELTLLDGKSRTPVNYTLDGVIVIGSGKGVYMTTPIIADMYMPIVQITYGSYWGVYTEEYQFNGTTGRSGVATKVSTSNNNMSSIDLVSNYIHK